MRTPRWILATAAIGLATVLSGCVVVPAGPYGYRHGYYREAAPVVVEPVVVAPAPRYGGYGYRRDGWDRDRRDWR